MHPTRCNIVNCVEFLGAVECESFINECIYAMQRRACSCTSRATARRSWARGGASSSRAATTSASCCTRTTTGAPRSHTHTHSHTVRPTLTADPPSPAGSRRPSRRAASPRASPDPARAQDGACLPRRCAERGLWTVDCGLPRPLARLASRAPRVRPTLVRRVRFVSSVL